VIALGGASGYQTRGIPHAWLVSPTAEIVWEGHPSGLTQGIIEQHLKGVRPGPTVELPSELRGAKRYFDAGKYATGVKELEKYLKSPKDEEVAKSAREAIEKVNAYVKGKIESAAVYAKEGYYSEAMEILQETEKIFKGLEGADEAKAKVAEWKKDAKIKLELEAGAYLQKARELIDEKQYRSAAPLLARITNAKKYEGTKVRELAEKELEKIKGKL
jgi:tetratricopeptide (TPR) repeat protein